MVVFFTACAELPMVWDTQDAEKVAPTIFKRPFPEPETGQPIVVAVYNFTDKTGQRKDSGAVAKL